MLERRARPDDVRRAFYALRDAGFDNISLDLIYGIPGQSAADLERDLAEALALEPEHLSCYELEAKPGTRFTHAHGDELARQAEAMEDYFERVVDDADRRRLPLVRDGELLPRRATGRDLRARHNLAYWLGRDYLGLGIGAVSTVARPALAEHAAARGATSPRSRRASGRERELEQLDARTRGARAACCSGCGSTSRSRSPGSTAARRPRTRSSGSSGSGSSQRDGGERRSR